MILGALLDAGAPATHVRAALAGLGAGEIRMRVTRVRRGALAARYVAFRGSERTPAERRFREILRLLQRASLETRVRERSLRVFWRLAEAEARVHGVAPEEVHFHELGAIDTLGDVVGVCAALESLGVERITASPLALGHGSVETSHGRLPLPAPAALEALRGVPTYPADVSWETVTPTGAAILGALCDAFGPMPALTPSAQGYGAGNDRPGSFPNVLRAVLGVGAPALDADVVSVLETNLDDMNPEQLPFLVETLLEAGALDVALSPLLMKKGRPGQLLRVLAHPSDRERLIRRILLESTTIGVRYHEMARQKLPRSSVTVPTRFGPIRVKRVRLPDGGTESAPEYESCARAARRHAVPLREVYRAAERAAEAAAE